jgi:hypothetical protein
MVVIESISKAFIKYRTSVGLLIALATWFAFAVFFSQPGYLTPSICILLLMTVSNTYDPKKVTLLAAILGVVAGLIWFLHTISQNTGNGDIFTWIGTMIGLEIGVAYFLLSFAFLGFLYGYIASLFRRGVIF